MVSVTTLIENLRGTLDQHLFFSLLEWNVISAPLYSSEKTGCQEHSLLRRMRPKAEDR